MYMFALIGAAFGVIYDNHWVIILGAILYFMAQLNEIKAAIEEIKNGNAG